MRERPRLHHPLGVPGLVLPSSPGAQYSGGHAPCLMADVAAVVSEVRRRRACGHPEFTLTWTQIDEGWVGKGGNGGAALGSFLAGG